MNIAIAIIWEGDMRIIIAGDGKVGRILTQKLSMEGHDLTLIDQDQSVLDVSMERFDVMAVQGNCASMQVLIQAGIRKADLLIAVTGADEINLLCAMTAHGINPDVHTIARIRNPEYNEQIYNMRSLFGLSLIVNPEYQAAREISRLLKYPGFLKRDTFAKGRVEIVELKVEEGSKLCNMPICSLNHTLKTKVIVCAVRRDGQTSIPDGNYILKQGDRIHVTAATNDLTLLLKNLGIITNKVKRVIICGGGRISYYLADDLQKSGMHVEIIEKDPDRCVELANRLPDVDVVKGDGSSQLLLDSMGVENTDALVAMTTLDEMNMIISLYGKSCGVKQVVTKVAHLENNSMMDSLSIGSVICAKELCCNNIVTYVRAMQNKSGAALAIHAIADGEAEALEFVVDEKVRNTGVPLKELKFKRNVRIVSIRHMGKGVEFPTGESVMKKGDAVIIVSGGDNQIRQINDIFL